MIPVKIVQFALDNLKNLIPLSCLHYGRERPPLFYSAMARMYFEFLLQTQYMPPHKLQRLQILRLKGVLKSAEKILWWKERFKSANFEVTKFRMLSDLQTIPITPKEDLLEISPAELCRVPITDNDYLVLRATSGTNGVPIKWALDRATHFIECGAYHLRNLESFKFPVFQNLRRRFVFMVNHYNVEMHHLGLLASDIHLQVDPLIQSSSSLRGERLYFYAELERTAPSVIFGSTTNLWYLGQKIIEDRARAPASHIISTGYVLTEETGRFFEETFGCRVSSFYGSQEVPAIGFLCPENNNSYHLNVENIVMEIVDDKGMPLPPGEWGHIVLTCLSNLIMPIIRYRIGDVGRVVEGRCPCGRTLPRFELLGRDYEFLYLPGGDKVPMRFLQSIILRKAFRKIYQYQVRQAAPGEAHIHILPKDWSEADEFAIKESVNKIFGGALSVKFFVAKDFPESGRKHKSFVPLSQ